MARGRSILLIGATGLVGSRLAEILGKEPLLTPLRKELDITQKMQVDDYFQRYRLTAVIHCADFTDVSQAEQQRGDTNEICWQVGVNGTRHVVEAAANVGAYMIFFSTGSVFAGDQVHPGPFTEIDAPAPYQRLSWHGWTKVIAEQLVVTHGAIIRISHPLKRARGTKLDYLQKAMALYDQKKLYPLFTDQRFPITWIDDLTTVILALIKTRKKGIFHVASNNFCSPYELMMHALSKRDGKAPRLQTTTFSEFIRHSQQPQRYSQFSALDVTATQNALRLTFPTWQEIVDRVL